MSDEMPTWNGKPIDQMDDAHLENTINRLRLDAAYAGTRAAQCWSAKLVFDHGFPSLVGPMIRSFDHFAEVVIEKDRLAGDMQALLEVRRLEAKAAPSAAEQALAEHPPMQKRGRTDREREIDERFDVQENARKQQQKEDGFPDG